MGHGFHEMAKITVAGHPCIPCGEKNEVIKAQAIQIF